MRRLTAHIQRENLIEKRARKSRPPPIASIASTISTSSSTTIPSPRNVSFRDPVRSPRHTHRGDEDDEVGDRAGTPPLASAHTQRDAAHDAARERRERRAEREREKEREKEEKKERERAERLALTDRLSLPASLTSVPLPPRYRERRKRDRMRAIINFCIIENLSLPLHPFATQVLRNPSRKFSIQAHLLVQPHPPPPPPHPLAPQSSLLLLNAKILTAALFPHLSSSTFPISNQSYIQRRSLSPTRRARRARRRERRRKKRQRRERKRRKRSRRYQ